MQFSHLPLLALALATSGALADTCELSAFNNAASTINGPGGQGTGSSNDAGFFLVINGGDATLLTPDNGNGFPPNYACPDSPEGGLYGYATFAGTEKGDLGICTTASGEDDLPGENFDCEDLAGVVTKGSTDFTFAGITSGTASGCTITFDC